MEWVIGVVTGFFSIALTVLGMILNSARQDSRKAIEDAADAKQRAMIVETSLRDFKVHVDSKFDGFEKREDERHKSVIKILDELKTDVKKLVK